MDALGHCWTDGLLWNGQSTDKVTSYGIEWAGIEQVGQFITRGVMLDIAKYKGVDNLGLGEVITAEDMEACARAQGVEIQPGDVLLLRTGWYTVFSNDYELWKQNFGNSSTGIGAAIPEPSAAVLALAGLVGLVVRRGSW